MQVFRRRDDHGIESGFGDRSRFGLEARAVRACGLSLGVSIHAEHKVGAVDRGDDRRVQTADQAQANEAQAQRSRARHRAHTVASGQRREEIAARTI